MGSMYAGLGVHKVIVLVDTGSSPNKMYCNFCSDDSLHTQLLLQHMSARVYTDMSGSHFTKGSTC